MDSNTCIAFVGGGNMASAVIGGLLRQGLKPEQLMVIEPYAPQREKLKNDFQIAALPASDPSMRNAQLVVWAVKPQMFKEAAAPCAAYVSQALHLSVMAGIPSQSISHALNAQRIVRAMPNTPALIGQGITGLFALAEVSQSDKRLIEQMMATTGQTLWVDAEEKIDAVTALSGSGPAYVFYFIEAMMRAGEKMGLSAEQSRQLAQSTFAGAAALAQQSSESPQTLRERVTSKGGTTYAAITSMQESEISVRFEAALHAAYARAGQLGKEFGA